MLRYNTFVCFAGIEYKIGVKGRVSVKVDGQYEPHVYDTYWLWEQYERLATTDFWLTKGKGWIDACPSECTEPQFKQVSFY